MSSGHDHQSVTQGTPRRSFLTRLAASVVGGVLVLFPFAAGWGVLTDPLRRRRDASPGDGLPAAGFVRIAALDALPADGVPRPFPVTADIADAWTRAAGQRIGVLFLTRTEVESQPHVTAFTSVCPHLGCAVEFNAAADRFECPCHESGFSRDGANIFGPSLRGLDPLAVKLVEADGVTQIWVAYQRFRAGVAERIPVA